MDSNDKDSRDFKEISRPIEEILKFQITGTLVIYLIGVVLGIGLTTLTLNIRSSILKVLD